MSSFLLIDTALQTASVALASDSEVIAFRQNEQSYEHAAWLHPAIQSLFMETGLNAARLDAVGVTAGPGSYTGLRVGMAAAKGFCFAQQIPLIAVSTLQLIAAGAQEEAQEVIIALIDARRDEVYAGVFDRNLQPLAPEQAMILGPDSFQQWRAKNQVLFTGNGAQKIERLLGSSQFNVTTSKNLIKKLTEISYNKWVAAEFADLAYHEPAYLKEFYTSPKVK